MSGLFDDETPDPAPPRVPPGGQQRSRALIGTIIVLVLAFFMISVFTGVWTDRLWFKSVGYSEVFTKVLGTKVLLFLVFGLLMAGVVAGNVVAAYRFRPLFRPASSEQVNLDRYREVVDPLRKWLLIGVAVVLGLFAGGSGSGQWRQFLLWKHGGSFGTKDASFHKDIGFYIFDLPWWHYLVDFGMAVTVLSLIAAAVVHYLFGGIRLQVKQDRFSGAAQVQISVLAGCFVLFKAADFWLDRYNLTSNGGGLFTGIGFTDKQAVLPSKAILTAIALICAVLFFANIFRRTWLLPSVGLALLVLSMILLGVIWPGIVQQFQVSPSEPDKEAPYLAKNIAATRQAYGIDKTQVTPFTPKESLNAAQLAKDQPSLEATRLLDPSLANAAFEQLQQVRGYYSVARVLDVDRYRIGDRTRDIVIAARELDQAGLPDGQQNWANQHTVYTHGYGMIAAYGNQRDRNDQPVTNEGKPVWAEQDLPPRGDLTDMFKNGYQPRIYFGEKSPDYSIVGRAPGGRKVELDLPGGVGLDPDEQHLRRQGGRAGRQPVQQAAVRREVQRAEHRALEPGEPELQDPLRPRASHSRAEGRAVAHRRRRRLSRRDRRPGQVDPRRLHHDRPLPEQPEGLAAVDDLRRAEPEHDVRDAAHGRDQLHEELREGRRRRVRRHRLPLRVGLRPDREGLGCGVPGHRQAAQLDPQGPARPHALPRGPLQGAAQHARAVPRHRPEDVLRRQRQVDRARRPREPLEQAAAVPAVGAHPDTGSLPVFSLTSVYTPNRKQNLAAFISVDADASRQDYGTIRILRLPGDTQVPGPSQIANNFGQDADIQGKLVAFTKANSKAIYGNLLTLPVGDGFLYVQPLYAQRVTGEGRYPALRYVLVSFGEDVGIGTTLQEALDDVLGTKADNTSPPAQGGGGEGAGNGAIPDNVRSLLVQAEQKFAQARRSLKAGDLQGYAKAQQQARTLVQEALNAADKAAAQQSKKKASAKPSAKPSATSSAKPSAKSSSKPSSSPSSG